MSLIKKNHKQSNKLNLYLNRLRKVKRSLELKRVHKVNLVPSILAVKSVVSGVSYHGGRRLVGRLAFKKYRNVKSLTKRKHFFKVDRSTVRLQSFSPYQLIRSILKNRQSVRSYKRAIKGLSRIRPPIFQFSPRREVKYRRVTKPFYRWNNRQRHGRNQFFRPNSAPRFFNHFTKFGRQFNHNRFNRKNFNRKGFNRKRFNLRQNRKLNPVLIVSRLLKRLKGRVDGLLKPSFVLYRKLFCFNYSYSSRPRFVRIVRYYKRKRVRLLKSRVDAYKKVISRRPVRRKLIKRLKSTSKGVRRKLIKRLKSTSKGVWFRYRTKKSIRSNTQPDLLRMMSKKEKARFGFIRRQWHKARKQAIAAWEAKKNYNFGYFRFKKYYRGRRVTNQPRLVKLKRGGYALLIVKGERRILRPLKLRDLLPPDSFWKVKTGHGKFRKIRCNGIRYSSRFLIRARTKFDYTSRKLRKGYLFNRRLGKYLQWFFIDGRFKILNSSLSRLYVNRFRTLGEDRFLGVQTHRALRWGQMFVKKNFFKTQLCSYLIVTRIRPNSVYFSQIILAGGRLPTKFIDSTGDSLFNRFQYSPGWRRKYGNVVSRNYKNLFWSVNRAAVSSKNTFAVNIKNRSRVGGYLRIRYTQLI